MGQSRRKCSITPLFFHIFIENNVSQDYVWYDKNLERIYQKGNILTLADIFAYNSNSIRPIPQRASFSHAGTQLLYLPGSILTGDNPTIRPNLNYCLINWFDK